MAHRIYIDAVKIANVKNIRHRRRVSSMFFFSLLSFHFQFGCQTCLEKKKRNHHHSCVLMQLLRILLFYIGLKFICNGFFSCFVIIHAHFLPNRFKGRESAIQRNRGRKKNVRKIHKKENTSENTQVLEKLLYIVDRAR